MSKNYGSLMAMRCLKNIVELFVNSFFVMYFLNVSSNNVFKLGLYYIFAYTVVYFTIFSLKNFCKRKNRIYILRIGIVFNLIYFLLILFLRERIVDYIYLMGIIFGLEEGFYFSVYNNFESSGVSNKQRAKFSGTYTILKSIINIVVPIIFGSIINGTGFLKCTVIVIVLVIFLLICSALFKDNPPKEYKKTDLKKYNDIVRNSKLLRRVYNVCFINGFLYTGAFTSIVTLYIIKVLNSSLDLGIFSSIFALLVCILGFLFAKVIPEEKYNLVLKLSTLFTIVGLILIMFKLNFVTVVIFNFCQTFATTLIGLMISKFELDVSNCSLVKNEYKVEYFVTMEKKHIYR